MADSVRSALAPNRVGEKLLLLVDCPLLKDAALPGARFVGLVAGLVVAAMRQGGRVSLVGETGPPGVGVKELNLVGEASGG